MFLIYLLDAAGLAFTLLALALLAAGGYLLAVRVLGEEARRDVLALAIASLLAMTAEALAVSLLLGATGHLDFRLALLLQTLLVAGLALTARRARNAAATTAAAPPAAGEVPAGGSPPPLASLARRTWARLREHPALSLITAHAVGSEALRGLLRPPLSFDSLMYHLLLTANWLQEGNLKVLNGNYPLNDYGYVTANGSLWFWWWMAPSHSELYVNLACLPQWLLLGLAAGGIARQLGARRNWPLASFLVLLTPVVVRFVATQYVDIFLAAALLGACFFFMRWLERPYWGYAALAGAGCGLAGGTKILGLPYIAALAAAVLVLVPQDGDRRPSRAILARAAAWAVCGAAALAAFVGLRDLIGVPYATLLALGLVVLAPLAGGRWRLRVPQLALTLLLTVALGSYFYLRNIALGAGPVALSCEGRTAGGAVRGPTDIANLGTAGNPVQAPPPRALPMLPRRESVLDLWATVGREQVLDSFLGITRPQSVELGFGPQSFLLLLAFLALPFGVAAPHRRLALLVVSQAGFELLFWLTVPYAANLALFANLRYLIPAAGLAFAGGIAVAEQRGMSDLWMRGLAIALACQGLLQLHAEMPRGVRLALAACDLAALALGMSAALRATVRRRPRLLAAAALVAALIAAPFWARFRVADRSRALTHEWTAHQTSTFVFTSAWRWLGEHGGNGTVAVIASPATYFVYPAMGPYLERKARYINVNAANYDAPHRYRFCNPRVDPSFPAWIENLIRADVRWLLVSRYPEFNWPGERIWAEDHPELFALRFSDNSNLLYEFHPAPLIPWRTAHP
jgi:hypothetical protein